MTPGRVIPDLRTCLAPLNVWVVPKTVLIPHAKAAFDGAGNLTSEALVRELAAAGQSLVRAVKAGLATV